MSRSYCNEANISDNDGVLSIKDEDGKESITLVPETYKMGPHSDPYNPDKVQICVVYPNENGMNCVDLDKLPELLSGTTRHKQVQEEMEKRDQNLKGKTPISGYSNKKGELVFNSTTFNAQNDEYHGQGREMSPLEQNKIMEAYGLKKQEEEKKE